MKGWWENDVIKSNKMLCRRSSFHDNHDRYHLYFTSKSVIIISSRSSHIESKVIREIVTHQVERKSWSDLWSFSADFFQDILTIQSTFFFLWSLYKWTFMPFDVDHLQLPTILFIIYFLPSFASFIFPSPICSCIMHSFAAIIPCRHVSNKKIVRKIIKGK